MSWLLAGFIPALMMLSTVGLQRLESVLHSDRQPAGTTLVSREKRENVVPLTGLSGLSPRMEPAYRLIPDEPGLPTRLYGAMEPNTGVSALPVR